MERDMNYAMPKLRKLVYGPEISCESLAKHAFIMSGSYRHSRRIDKSLAYLSCHWRPRTGYVKRSEFGIADAALRLTESIASTTRQTPAPVSSDKNE